MVGGGGRPLLPEILGQLAAVGAKSQNVRDWSRVGLLGWTWDWTQAEHVQLSKANVQLCTVLSQWNRAQKLPVFCT